MRSRESGRSSTGTGQVGELVKETSKHCCVSIRIRVFVELGQLLPASSLLKEAELTSVNKLASPSKFD